MGGVVLTKMKRFLQDPGSCAFGAVASVANFSNRKVDYDFVCGIQAPDGQGLYTPDIGILLNKVGFTEVKIISADLDQLDFQWATLSKTKLAEEIKRSCRRHPDEGYREVAKSYVKFLNDPKNNNELIIDMHFGEYIRHTLDKGIPVLANFNWHLFFNMPKTNERGEKDPIKGDIQSHEIVIYGYDDKGVRIVDSHHEMYKGKLKKFGSGRYKMDWETLMTVLGCGDIIIPSGYSERNYELV